MRVATKSATVLALVHQISTVTESFSPCPAPRFDDFSEKLVGTWREKLRRERKRDEAETTASSSKADGDADTGGDDLFAVSVEEVMRSCGGAVQGIRETNGVYLNRASDGFVYFPDGSYSSGPTSIDITANITPESGTETMTCLCFGRSTRFLVDTPPPCFRSADGFGGDDLHLPQDVSVALQTRSSSGALPPRLLDPLVCQRTIGDAESDSFPVLPFDFLVNVEIQCRMPVSSQKWMLQRVHWEQHRTAMPGHSTDLTDDDHSANGDHSWVAILSAEDFHNRRLEGATVRPSVASSLEAGSRILQVGATHQGLVKILSRVYSPNGGLERVLWSEGVQTRSGQ
jgi:hypothetical protein